jgi:hypothetical protein
MWHFKHGSRGRHSEHPKIKVHSFPALEVARLPNGGWQLHNRFVVYTADLSPDGVYKRGIHGLPPYLPSKQGLARPQFDVFQYV